MVNVILYDLPYSVRGLHVANEDGTYTVFINNKFTPEQQIKTLRHELEHINRSDLISDKSADIIEKELKG